MMSSSNLWSAFPTGFLEVPGTSTIGRQQVLRGRDNQCLWFWPQELVFAKPGASLFDETRPTGVLLPDLSDDATWWAVLRLLAQRVGIPNTRGVSWVPKAGEVVDRKRGSVGKAVVGWTVRSLTRSATFPIPQVSDEEQALLVAVAMTNCACGRGVQRDCPQHGEIKARPWR